MNLLEKPTIRKESDYENGVILYEDFREFQYYLLEDFFRIAIEYLSIQNNNYLEVRNIEIKDKFTYFGINNNELKQIDITVFNKKSNTEKRFLRTYIPKLIDGTYFMLNENYYTPAIYILDKPIIVKSGSIKLYSLFNSLTIFAKKDMCIFVNQNIPLSYFLQLFLKDTENEKLYDQVVQRFNLIAEYHDDSDIMNYFNNLFNLQTTTKQQIIEYIEKLFFDQYTQNLYKICYNNLSLVDNVIKSVKMLLDNKTPSFIDLNNKRLVFMELLLSPFFKKIGLAAQQTAKGYPVDEIKIDLIELVKHFLKTKDKKNNNQSKSSSGLDGNYLYNIANLYGGIVNNKCCFVNPGSTNPPSDIASIHPTHFKTICPITIADTDPGHTISVIPETTVDWFGNFKNLSDFLQK